MDTHRPGGRHAAAAPARAHGPATHQTATPIGPPEPRPTVWMDGLDKKLEFSGRDSARVQLRTALARFNWVVQEDSCKITAKACDMLSRYIDSRAQRFDLDPVTVVGLFLSDHFGEEADVITGIVRRRGSRPTLSAKDRGELQRAAAHTAVAFLTYLCHHGVVPSRHDAYREAAVLASAALSQWPLISPITEAFDPEQFALPCISLLGHADAERLGAHWGTPYDGRSRHPLHDYLGDHVDIARFALHCSEHSTRRVVSIKPGPTARLATVVLAPWFDNGDRQTLYSRQSCAHDHSTSNITVYVDAAASLILRPEFGLEGVWANAAHRADGPLPWWYIEALRRAFPPYWRPREP